MTARLIVIPVGDDMGELNMNQVVEWAAVDPPNLLLDTIAPSRKAAMQYATHQDNVSFCRCSACQAFRRCAANLLLSALGAKLPLDRAEHRVDPMPAAECTTRERRD